MNIRTRFVPVAPPLVLTILLAIFIVLPVQSSDFRHYKNSKYFYSFDYPNNLERQAASDRAASDQAVKPVANKATPEKEIFQSPSSALRLSTWTRTLGQIDENRTRNEFEYTLKNLASGDLPDPHVSYKAKGADWFVVSGTSNDNLFYQRTVVGRSVSATVSLIYPRQQKEQFDKTVAHVAESLCFDEAKPPPHSLSEDQAIELVSHLPEVHKWSLLLMHTKGAGKPSFTASKEGNTWTVHVFEMREDHTATFGWYDVDALLHKIKKTM